jgi:hypothetical protein
VRAALIIVPVPGFDLGPSVGCSTIALSGAASADGVPRLGRNLDFPSFDVADDPSGVVTLVFSGGAAIRLEVECLECQMSDLGPVWETTSAPAHETDS